jgi:hypothetical protein
MIISSICSSIWSFLDSKSNWNRSIEKFGNPYNCYIRNKILSANDFKSELDNFCKFPYTLSCSLQYLQTHDNACQRINFVFFRIAYSKQFIEAFRRYNQTHNPKDWRFCLSDVLVTIGLKSKIVIFNIHMDLILRFHNLNIIVYSK